MKNKKLRRNRYGQFYNPKVTTKRESERIYRGGKVTAKDIKVERESVSYSTKTPSGKTRFKTEILYKYIDEDGKEVSKKEYTKNEKRKEINKKTASKNKGGIYIQPEVFEETYISTSTIFEDILDSSDNYDIYFNGKKLTSIIEIDNLFKKIREMLKGRHYPRFVLKRQSDSSVYYEFAETLPERKTEEGTEQ